VDEQFLYCCKLNKVCDSYSARYIADVLHNQTQKVALGRFWGIRLEINSDGMFIMYVSIYWYHGENVNINIP
jgi:hypothetical protein